MQLLSDITRHTASGVGSLRAVEEGERTMLVFGPAFTELDANQLRNQFVAPFWNRHGGTGTEHHEEKELGNNTDENESRAQNITLTSSGSLIVSSSPTHWSSPAICEFAIILP
jgi:hypothetical protein